MKKLLALTLALCMIFALCACGKSSSAMSYAEYCAAAVDSEVEIECCVQDHQSWWDNKITVYAADKDGAYLLYNLTCSEEDAAKLVPGTRILVKGYKAEWAGEVEVAEGATFEFVKGDSYVAQPVDLTDVFGTDKLTDYMNRYFTVKNAVLTSAPLYKWDGSGAAGDDLYFNVDIGGNEFNFTVESYLRGDGTEVYDTIEALQPGATVNLTGFLYWYEGANPHITEVEVVG